MQSPPIGADVLFYKGGDHDSDPMCAKVVKSGSDGQVMLLLYPGPGGGEMIGGNRWCRHIDDPWVKDHKDQLRKPTHGKPNGAWDWIPGCPYNATMVEPGSDTKGDDMRRKGFEQLSSMLEEGVERRRIWNTVRGYGIKKVEFEKAVEEHLQPA